MQVSSVRYEGGALILGTSDPVARKFVYQFKPGEYEIKKTRKKRSLDSNSYLWILCSKIADVVGITKEEVYRRNVREGTEYYALTLPEEAVEQFSKHWQKNGIAWFTDVVDKTQGGVTVFAYYGSSTYDSRMMSQLIERVAQDCKALDIETMTPRELSLLMEGWDEKRD